MPLRGRANDKILRVGTDGAEMRGYPPVIARFGGVGLALTA